MSTNLDIEGRFTTAPATSSHRRLTHAIIRTSRPTAPTATRPTATSSQPTPRGPTHCGGRWRTQGCTVISQSFHRRRSPERHGAPGGRCFEGGPVLRGPLPTILQAAGNFISGGGADNSTRLRTSSSTTRGSLPEPSPTTTTPPARWPVESTFHNPTSAQGDRELPELAANGPGRHRRRGDRSGTSFAAPAAAGVTALLQDVDGTLRVVAGGLPRYPAGRSQPQHP